MKSKTDYAKRLILLHGKVVLTNQIQKQPPTGVLKKRCSEYMQQIYRRTPMPNCDFKHLY